MPTIAAECLNQLMGDSQLTSEQAIARLSIDSGVSRRDSAPDLIKSPGLQHSSVRQLTEFRHAESHRDNVPETEGDTDEAKVNVDNQTTVESDTDSSVDRFSTKFAVDLLDNLKRELCEKTDKEVTWKSSRSPSVPYVFPTKSNVATEVSEWLNRITSKGFLKAEQSKYMENISYEEEEEEIDFEEGVCRIFDPYYSLDLENISSVEGDVDKKGYPRNRSLVTTKSGDDLYGIWKNGLRSGYGKSTGENFEKHGLQYVQGFYTDGILHGYGSARDVSGLTYEGVFNNGYLEGPVVGVPDRGSLDNTVSKDYLHLSYKIAQLRKGLPTGYIWQQVEGGGWIHGKVDGHGELTGNSIMYIYPDIFTCLVGTFEKGIMKAGRLSYIEDIRYEEEILVVLPNKEIIDPTVHKYSPSSPLGFTVQKMNRDPYENMRCTVGTSFISGAGDGLFARVDISLGEVVSFYHGVHYPYGKKCENRSCDYQIFLDWDSAPKSDYIDIPTEDTDTEVYCASLAHKINHSFNPNCKFIKFYHPTFGSQLLGVVSLREIYCGEEYTVNYKYDVKEAPEWYQNIFLTEFNKLRGHFDIDQ